MIAMVFESQVNDTSLALPAMNVTLSFVTSKAYSICSGPNVSCFICAISTCTSDLSSTESCGAAQRDGVKRIVSKSFKARKILIFMQPSYTILGPNAIVQKYQAKKLLDKEIDG